VRKEPKPRWVRVKTFSPEGVPQYRMIEVFPRPSEAELYKIRQSLNMPLGSKFFRCPAKNWHKVFAFQKSGDSSHSGAAKKHRCDECRCKWVAGYGTRHYGVGLCVYHEHTKNGSMNKNKIAKGMALTIQQGYPVEPYRYETQSQFIERIRKSADDAGGSVNLREELNLMRSHLQLFEKRFGDKGNHKRLQMMTKFGPDVMTDEVRVDCITKLIKAVASVARDQYVITESDYIHADEVKVWFFAIWKAIEKNIDSLIKGEIDVNMLKEKIRLALIEIPLPKSGKRK
jgi:hypothetical protein